MIIQCTKDTVKWCLNYRSTTHMSRVHTLSGEDRTYVWWREESEHHVAMSVEHWIIFRVLGAYKLLIKYKGDTKVKRLSRKKGGTKMKGILFGVISLGFGDTTQHEIRISAEMSPPPPADDRSKFLMWYENSDGHLIINSEVTLIASGSIYFPILRG